MTIIFARTRHNYDSYTDYWRIVELSGFPVCYVGDMDLQADATYIVSPINGEFRPHLEMHGANRKSRLVWWNLERPDAAGSPPLSVVVDDMLKYVDTVWVSDRHYAALDPRQRFVVLGSHPGLGDVPAAAPTFDFTHQSYVWGRRQAPIEALQRRWREGPNAWDTRLENVRHTILRTSRTMVNVHQTPAPVGEPLRFALAAAYRLPLLTETLADPWPLVEGVDFMAASLDRMPQLIESAFIGNPAPMGERLHQRLCVEWTFRRGVEEGVAAMESQQ